MVYDLLKILTIMINDFYSSFYLWILKKISPFLFEFQYAGIYCKTVNCQVKKETESGEQMFYFIFSFFSFDSN